VALAVDPLKLEPARGLARQRHMSTLRYVSVGIASVAALSTSFAVGVAVGDDSTPGGRDQVAVAAGLDRSLVVSQSTAMVGELTSAASCAELLEWYVDEGIKRVGPYGWDTLGYDRDLMVFAEGATQTSPTPLTASRAQGGNAMGASTASATGTNVQEEGVDEPDVVKTNGTLLVRMQGTRLTTYDVSGARPEQLATLRLDDISAAEILLVEDTVIVLGLDDESANPTGRTRMIHVDVADPSAPQVAESSVFSSTLLGATQHGTTVRLTLSEGLPDLDFTQPRRWRSEKSALRRNQEVVRDSTITDWLPTLTLDGQSGEAGEAEQLAQCTSVAIPEESAGLGTLSVVGFDATAPESWDVVAVATESQTAYTSDTHLYLATTTGWGGGWWGGQCCIDDWGVPQTTGADGVTDLHAFELDGISASYVASGEVEGSIADRWSMDESDDVLRVAVGATQATGNFNSLVTLAIKGDELVEVGRLDKLGVNENIQSMRWFDDLAVMVTFRQVDPLFAIDLSSDARPRLLGELKIPGFSDYLHPLGPHRLIGMGVDASRSGNVRGAQAGLFNLYDVTKPWQESKVTYGRETAALAGGNPRQFTWLPEERIALTVIARGYGSRTGFVSVLKVVDGEFENRMVEVEYGDEVSEVRLVPLLSGKVVLVTGDDISFFPLAG
jgi:Beta propeller domain